MSKANKKLLILITFLSLVVRLYHPAYPPLLPNEINPNYHNYSLLLSRLYACLTIPFITILGHTPVAIRLPSIILGSLLPYFLYLLITQISPKSQKLAILSATILAFNPINIHFSKIADPANILSMGLLLTPLFFYRKKYIISTVTLLITLSGCQNISFISQPTRLTIYRYLDHYSPRLLTFATGWQNLYYTAPYIGILLYPSLIFFVVGLFSSHRKLKRFFLVWLLIAPLPATLTSTPTPTLTTMGFSLPMIFFIALGLHTSLKKYHHPIVYTLLVISYLLSFIYYSDLYYNHMSKTPSHNSPPIINKSLNNSPANQSEALTYNA